ncbi:MAG: hypothetical protein AAFY71_08035, partial [Bacteroidota bacterium]
MMKTYKIIPFILLLLWCSGCENGPTDGGNLSDDELPISLMKLSIDSWGEVADLLQYADNCVDTCETLFPGDINQYKRDSCIINCNSPIVSVVSEIPKIGLLKCNN